MEDTRILIVEDESIIAYGLGRILENLGYTVAAIVASGEEAIEKASQLQPNLVLMDIVLRGELDGIEAAEQIRAHWDIPVIYTTAYEGEEILQRARVTEPFGYILKPFEGRNLHTNIQMALYRHRTERRLRESEERYRSLFDGVPVGLYRITPTGQIIDANPSLVQILGYADREALLATEIADRYVHPLAHRQWQELLDQQGEVPSFETQWYRGDGTVIWVSDNARAVRDERGEVLFYEGAVEDISERKQAEQERERLIAELQQALVKVKTLSGLLPICASCKKIRDDQGYWHQVEVYVRAHAEVEFSHGLCPDCAKELYPELGHDLE